jgi:hypothetical protein
MVPEGEDTQAQLPDFSVDDEADLEFVEELGATAEQVSSTKSHEDT